MGLIVIKDRKNNDWILQNRENGDIIRFSFENKEPTTKAGFPTLVDLKITNYCTFGCSMCLPGDVKIEIPNGKKNISELNKGDSIISFNHSLNKIEETEIVHFFEREIDEEIYEITTETGLILQITGNHEVFIKDKGYINAEDLEEGDEIIHI